MQKQLALLSITNSLSTKTLDLLIALLKKVLKSMKIELPISWDWHKQEEGEVIVDIPESKCKEIVRHFLMKKDYELRREWLVENVPEINLNVPA
jgi:uncharacterized FlaG/YvyC family protein